MKYQTKIVTIEAEPFLENSPLPFRDKENPLCFNGEKWYISTLEGDMLASYGDYIIKGLKGEFYPCKPEIFHMKYEAIHE